MLSLGNLPLDLAAETGSVSEASAQQQQEQQQQQQEREGEPLSVGTSVMSSTIATWIALVEQIQQAASLDATLQRAVHPPTALASLPPTVAHLVIRHWQLKVRHWQLKAVTTNDDAAVHMQ